MTYEFVFKNESVFKIYNALNDTKRVLFMKKHEKRVLTCYISYRKVRDIINTNCIKFIVLNSKSNGEFV